MFWLFRLIGTFQLKLGSGTHAEYCLTWLSWIRVELKLSVHITELFRAGQDGGVYFDKLSILSLIRIRAGSKTWLKHV